MLAAGCAIETGFRLRDCGAFRCNLQDVGTVVRTMLLVRAADTFEFVQEGEKSMHLSLVVTCCSSGDR
jgi:hypothetical protein